MSRFWLIFFAAGGGVDARPCGLVLDSTVDDEPLLLESTIDNEALLLESNICGT